MSWFSKSNDNHGESLYSYDTTDKCGSDYTCAEWQAFDAAVDAAGGVDWDDQEQQRTYGLYHQAMIDRYNRGERGDVYPPGEGEVHQAERGFWGRLFG